MSKVYKTADNVYGVAVFCSLCYEWWTGTV